MPSVSLSGQTKQRQMVILAVGAVLLGGMLLFQLPKTLKMLRGSESVPAPAAQTAPPVAPGVPVTPVTPTPVPAHVASLTRFKSKDPFVQQINPNASAAAPTDGSSAAPASDSSAEAGTSQADEDASSGGSTTYDSATISVNGSDETVRVSSSFPAASPVFELVSLSRKVAKVAVANGALKSGSGTVTLIQGEPLTLMNTVDGKRYRLELISVSS